MACETPVIATDVGAITEFCNSDMARIINPGNVDAISEAIIDYFDNEAKTSLLVSNAKLQSLLLTPKLMADRIKRELDRCGENNL
jgi:glycosyltransferase involved in cell wall biosynthesis